MGLEYEFALANIATHITSLKNIMCNFLSSLQNADSTNLAKLQVIVKMHIIVTIYWKGFKKNFLLIKAPWKIVAYGCMYPCKGPLHHLWYLVSHA